jgi:hypothetical protein
MIAQAVGRRVRIDRHRFLLDPPVLDVLPLQGLLKGSEQLLATGKHIQG